MKSSPQCSCRTCKCLQRNLPRRAHCEHQLYQCCMSPRPSSCWGSPHQIPVSRTRIQLGFLGPRHQGLDVSTQYHITLHTLLHLVRIAVSGGALQEVALLPGFFFSFSESELITITSGFTLLFSFCFFIAFLQLSAAATATALARFGTARAARPLIRLLRSRRAGRGLAAGCWPAAAFGLLTGLASAQNGVSEEEQKIRSEQMY